MDIIKAKEILIAISIVFSIPLESTAKVKENHTAIVHDPRSVLISNYTTSEPKKCRTAIDSLVKEVKKTSGYLGVKRINARRNLNNIWSNAPRGDLFDLDIGGSQEIRNVSITAGRTNTFAKNKRMKR